MLMINFSVFKSTGGKSILIIFNDRHPIPTPTPTLTALNQDINMREMDQDQFYICEIIQSIFFMEENEVWKMKRSSELYLEKERATYPDKYED